jgi:hypothetical protein
MRNLNFLTAFSKRKDLQVELVLNNVVHLTESFTVLKHGRACITERHTTR